MLREYPNPEKYIEKCMTDAAERYVRGLKKRGLQPNPVLDRTFAQRAIKETQDAYIQELAETCVHNIKVIRKRYARECKKIKREGSRLAVLICIPATILFELEAWYNFTHGAPDYGVLCVIVGLIWLALLAAKVLFDR